MIIPDIINLDKITENPEIVKWEHHQTLGRKGARISTLFECKETHQKIALVQCFPGAFAENHIHEGHETFLMLDGCFEDDAGSYHKGDLIIYPPGSNHSWRTPEGALICAIWGGKTIKGTKL